MSNTASIMSNTASIMTVVKYEHDFINQWLEHHINIGFSHFYILVDNVMDIQPQYKINSDFKDYVTLIYFDKSTIEHYYENFRDICENCHNTSYYILSMVNKLVIDQNLLKEDWVTTIGIDQYIYINLEQYKTIQEFLSTISPDCSQIIYPWSIGVFNNENKNFDNLIQNISSYKYTYGWSGHSNGMIRRHLLKELEGSSHFFLSNQQNQKFWIINDYYDMPNCPNVYHLFWIVEQKMKENQIKDCINFTSFHFMLRNNLEIVIKRCFYWNISIFPLNKIADAIRNNDYFLFYNDERSGSHITKDNVILNLYLYNTNNKNTDNYYAQILSDKLKENGFDISPTEVKEWGNNLVLL